MFALGPGLYGLHRLGLYLERRGLIYYWHNKPTSGAGYNVFQEIYQPQIRYVVEVRDQRLGGERIDEGAPPQPVGRRVHESAADAMHNRQG